MIQISQMKLPCGTDASRLVLQIKRELRLNEAFSWEILRHSVDARKKPQLFDIYSVGVHLKGQQQQKEKKIVQSLRNRNIIYKEEKRYHFPKTPRTAPPMQHRPIVVGSGPAGLFCALELARHGYRPLLLERGERMEERIKSVEHFWATKELNVDSNIQFGEGGAGTFSDGKLTTGVKDPFGRNAQVLKTFIECGAFEDIAYENLPHIGTDVLRSVIVNLRHEIESAGGEVRFGAKMTDILEKDGAVSGIVVLQDGVKEEIPCDTLVLALGHSARDTIRMLHQKPHLEMTQKAFAVGFRVSHPQSMVNQQQYGISDEQEMQRLHLPACSYKLTAQTKSGRGVYSFCMCPGGYVVNASSQQGRLAVNGMSDHGRDSKRANSAIVMTVDGRDFGSEDVLAGLLFQESLEEKAYQIADGDVPVESYGDFKTRFLNGEAAMSPQTPVPLTDEEAAELCIKGRAARAELFRLLPQEMTADFIEGMESYVRRIPAFTNEEAYVIGLESRTSSPVRIVRDETCQSTIAGIYPCGEGAGYAGGITSAAMDGLKVAEAIAVAHQIPFPQKSDI